MYKLLSDIKFVKKLKAGNNPKSVIGYNLNKLYP